MDWSENALQVGEARLCKPGETLNEALARGAHTLFPDRREHAKRLYDLMTSKKFLPNTPAIRGLGDPEAPGGILACYVLPIHDTFDAHDPDNIYGTLHTAALVHKAGGGTGFCFSHLRPAGSMVGSTKGIASGPCSFIDLYNASTNVIKQGGQRRGANMATFSVYHPDAIDFITAKQDLSRWTNFNVSVMLDKAFFEAVEQDGYICQRFPVQWGKISPTPTCMEGKHVRARDLLDLIAQCAHATGEPGVLFWDLANKRNPHPELYQFDATNPCGEIWLGPNEACVLGSINVSRYLQGGSIDYTSLLGDARLGILALDRMIDECRYASPAIERATKRTRRLGLGVTGWADLLYQLRIPFDSDEALALARTLGEQLRLTARDASTSLTLTEGAYPASKDGRLRNVARTAIAPEGTRSILMDCSSGIGPRMAPMIKRQHRLDKQDGNALTVMYEAVDQHEPWARFAHDITPEWHVRMQAAWQNAFADNAVSYTINAPHDASVDDVRQSILQARSLGCLGWTYYRDGSRAGQVLSATADCSGAACSLEPVLAA